MIQSTFQEWIESDYARDGTQCQDCHMTPGPGYTRNPGHSTSIGKEREHIWTHNTAGGNIFQTKIQSPKHRSLAIKYLKNAATLKINTKQVTAERIFLDVIILNTGEGHSIPSGSNALRQMWLQFTATDEAGNVLFSSGQLDESGNIDPQATIYRSVYHDAEGKVTYDGWEAASIVSDNRIPAGQSATEEYEIKIPNDYSGSVKVTATLMYRTAPQSLIDELFGTAAENVPTVIMAEKELIIGGPGEGAPGFGILTAAIMIGTVVFLMPGKRD